MSLLACGPVCVHRTGLRAIKNRPEGRFLMVCTVGAGEMNRTPDLLITNELLYRLSYTGNRGQIIASVGERLSL